MLKTEKLPLLEMPSSVGTAIYKAPKASLRAKSRSQTVSNIGELLLALSRSGAHFLHPFSPPGRG